MREKIQEQLRRIEEAENIKILLSVESGSRAWGFASPDSDYDVRFIYIRRLEDYLRLDTNRDVIELPIDDVLDINGWDLQGCIWLYENSMEVRVYYSELGAEICKKSKHLPELYRLMNYINARLWVGVSDGMDGVLYQSQYLISPRFYITEDEMQDITATMLIPYTHFEMDVLELEDFITAALPSLLNSLSVPVFLLLEGRITVEEAIDMVGLEILGEKR